MNGEAARLQAVVAAQGRLLADAKQQIEYLHDKFSETGSGAAILSRIDAALSRTSTGAETSRPKPARCDDCGGSGLVLNMSGDPDDCRSCDGGWVSPLPSADVVKALREVTNASENLLIAVGMGWDLDGVTDAAIEANKLGLATLSAFPKKED